VQDLVSFAKGLSTDTVQYMRNYFDQNFAIYSILCEYRGYDISSDIDETGTIVYKIESSTNSDLMKFIISLDGKSMSVYGNTYVISVTNAKPFMMIKFTKVS
jgi:glycerol-3-phosphate dehydrogenase